jgi:hypothetical protein
VTAPHPIAKVNRSVSYKWVVLAVILGLAAAAVGCGSKPTADPRQFVGKWLQYIPDSTAPPDERPTIELRGDGTGATYAPPNPHRDAIVWYLRAGKLVITPRDGGSPSEYTYKFNGPDELILSTARGQATYKRRSSA